MLSSGENLLRQRPAPRFLPQIFLLPIQCLIALDIICIFSKFSHIGILVYRSLVGEATQCRVYKDCNTVTSDYVCKSGNSAKIDQKQELTLFGLTTLQVERKSDLNEGEQTSLSTHVVEQEI